MPSEEGLAIDDNGDGLPDIIAQWLNEGRLLFENTYILADVLDVCG